MGGVSLVAASHLRHNRRSTALIALLLALAVAIVLAALAGARRTDAAVGKFVAADKGADGYAVFVPQAFGGSASPDLVAEETGVQAIDGVARTARFTDAIVELSGPTVPGGHIGVQGWVGMEPDGMEMLGQFRLVAGRHADQSKSDEILIDEELARDAELAVGSRVDLRAFTSAQGFEGSTADAAGIGVKAEVVGIVRRPSDLRDPQTRQLQPNDYVVHQDVYMTAAFWDAAHGDIAGFNPMVAFDVGPDANLPEVLSRSTEGKHDAYAIDQSSVPRARRHLQGCGSQRQPPLEGTADLRRGARPWPGCSSWARPSVARSSSKHRTTARCSALGHDAGGSCGGAALLRAAPVAVAGAVLGVTGAVALSAAHPAPRDRGPAGGTASRYVGRRGRPHRRWDPCGDPRDARRCAAVRSGRRGSRSRSTASPTGRASRRAWPRAASRRPPSSACGSRSSPAGAVPPYPSGRLWSRPPPPSRWCSPPSPSRRRFPDSREHAEPVRCDVGRGGGRHRPVPKRSKASRTRYGRSQVSSAFAAMGTTAFDTPFGEIPTVMIRQEQGTMSPLITAGRAPGPGEVALGALTMQKQNLHIGDELEIRDPIAGSRNFKITGTVVLNVAGEDVSIPPGRGALFDWSMLALLDPKSTEFIAPKMFLVDVEPGRTSEVEGKLAARCSRHRRDRLRSNHSISRTSAMPRFFRAHSAR